MPEYMVTVEVDITAVDSEDAMARVEMAAQSVWRRARVVEVSGDDPEPDEGSGT